MYAARLVSPQEFIRLVRGEPSPIDRVLSYTLAVCGGLLTCGGAFLATGAVLHAVPPADLLFGWGSTWWAALFLAIAAVCGIHLVHDMYPATRRQHWTKKIPAFVWIASTAQNFVYLGCLLWFV